MLILDNSFKIFISDEELTLLPFKSVYFEKHRTLLVSDINLCRVGHFRNSPVSLPDGLAETDLVLLDRIINDIDISVIFILGDLFPKNENFDMRLFNPWRELHHNIDVNLVRENTDILSEELYNNFEIRVHRKYFLWNKFLFTHKPLDKDIKLTGCDYVFSGYINPRVNINGKGAALENLSCYFFDEKQCILPAFGAINRKSLVKPTQKQRAYVIQENGNGPVVLKVDRK